MQDLSHAHSPLLLTSLCHCITKAVMHGKQVSYTCNCYPSKKNLPEIFLLQSKLEPETGSSEAKQLVTGENMYLLRFNPTLSLRLKYTMPAEQSAACTTTQQHSQELKNTSSRSQQTDRFPSKPVSPLQAESCPRHLTREPNGSAPQQPRRAPRTRDSSRKAAQAQNTPPLQPLSGQRFPWTKMHSEVTGSHFPSRPLPPSCRRPAAVQPPSQEPGMVLVVVRLHRGILAAARSFPQLPARLRLVFSPTRAGFKAFFGCSDYQPSDSHMCPTKSALRFR